MPPFLPQARPQAFGDVSNQLLQLGKSVGNAVENRRERDIDQKLGEAAATGDLNVLMRVAGEAGRPDVALQANQLIAQRQDRAASRASAAGAREQAQSNADRSFGLQQEQFSEDKRQFDQELVAKMREIDIKHEKLGKVLTAGQEATDKEFAKEFVEFNSSGGFADVEKQLGQLEEVATQLESGDDSLTGSTMGNTPDFVAAFFPSGQRAIAARDAVQEVVQRNLRVILGAQFTEREGERLISRAYNPKLDEKENAKRVRRLMGQIRTAAVQKSAAANYFEANGTLVGFEGKLPSFADFNVEGDTAPGQTSAPVNVPAPPPGFVIQDASP